MEGVGVIGGATGVERRIGGSEDRRGSERVTGFGRREEVDGEVR